MDKIQIILISTSIVLILLLVGLTRSRKIRIQYSLLWFLSAFLLLIFSVFRDLLAIFAKFVNIYYAPSFIIVVIIFIGFVLGIHFSIVLSTLSEENKKLIQEVALLNNRIENLEKNKPVKSPGLD